MRYLLLSVLVIFAIGLFAVEDAFAETYHVNIEPGSSTPGCERTNSCHAPNSVTISQHDRVVWNNVDSANHTITSGTPAEGFTDVFDSGLIMPGRNFGYKFTDEGTYDYFCIIHPWATGVVIVQYSEGSVVDGKFVPTTSTPTTTTSTPTTTTSATTTTTSTTTISTTTSTLPAGAITYDVWACCPVAPESKLVLKSWQFIEKENYNQIKLYLTASNLREEFLRDVYAYPDSIILKNKDGGLYRGDSDPHSITYSYKETSRPRDATVTYDIDKKYGKSDKFSIYIQDALVGNQPQCDSPITLVNVVGRAEKLTYSIKYCKAGELGELTLSSSMGGGGCLIATAAFGSEMAPQVQFLRELRDNTVLQTESGTSFMAGFNQFYYSFSPTIADYERENPTFKEAVKITLTPLLASLTLLQYADIDSESEMLGYGIGIILLNIGMYFVAPAVLLSVCIRKIHKN